MFCDSSVYLLYKDHLEEYVCICAHISPTSKIDTDMKIIWN